MIPSILKWRIKKKWQETEDESKAGKGEQILKLIGNNKVE